MAKFLLTNADGTPSIFDTETAEYLGRLLQVVTTPEFYRLGEMLIEVYTPPVTGATCARLIGVNDLIAQALQQMRMGGDVSYLVDLITKAGGTPPSTLTAD